MRTPARATITFDRQLHYLVVQFNQIQNYIHIVGKMLEILMLYSHLQFEVHERRGRHRTRFVFFELFSYFSVVGDVPTPANFARQFWYKKTLKFIRILRQCMQNMP